MNSERVFIEGSDLSRVFSQVQNPLFRCIDISVEGGLQFLIGRNGVGKSQLAAILANARAPDSGHVQQFGSIGYLPQTIEPFPGCGGDQLGVSELLAANERVLRGDGSLEDIELLDGHWDVQAVTIQRLAELNLPERVLAQSCSKLSGGERTRLALLALKYANHDFLILDEPTNHLDREGRRWLTDWIHSVGNCLIVSHDRALLSHAETVFELSATGLKKYRGSWDTYRSSYEQQRIGAERQVSKASKEFQNALRTQQRSKERAQAHEARGKKGRSAANQSKIVLNHSKSTSEQSRSRTARLHDDRIEKAEEAVGAAQRAAERVAPLAFVVADPEPAAGHLVVTEDLSVKHCKLKPLSLQLSVGERVALRGRNGVGKSSLLKTLSGLIEPDKGSLRVCRSVALLDQEFSLLDAEVSALENFARLAPGWPEHRYRTVLAQVRLLEDHALYRTSWLSGGERLKVALACLFCGPKSPSLLLLDEPDNHMDLESKSLLESTLATYDGGLVVVSHDEQFIENVGVDREIDLEEMI